MSTTSSSTKRMARPPQPHPVDPRGPEEYTWPRGLFNFGNIVFALSMAVVIAIVVATILTV